MPGVVIGKNATIAWGLTTSYADVQDLYLEQVRDDTVRDGDRYVPLQVRTEEITVAGEEEPRTITVRSSRHGPLLSDANAGLADVGRAAAEAEPGPFAVSLAWTALTPNRTMDALFRLNTATTFAEFRAAAKLLAAPSQNLVYADTAGNIGYQLPGAIPVRGDGDGVRPSPGWDRRYDWQGTIPFEQLPYLYNPSSGYIVTANNQVIGDRYPYRIGSDYSYGWRSQEIIDTLERSPRHTVADSAELQSDDTVRFAADLVPDAAEGQDRRSLGGRGAADPGRLGLQQLRGIGRRRVLLRGRPQHREADLPRRDARGSVAGHRRPLVRRRLRSDQGPGQPVVGRHHHAAVVEKRDDILINAMTDARKELTVADLAGHRGMGLGEDPPGHPAQPDTGQERHRRHRADVQPWRLSGGRGRRGGQRDGATTTGSATT